MLVDKNKKAQVGETLRKQFPPRTADLTSTEFLAMFHGNDERISEASLGLSARLYSDVLRRFGELTAR